MRKCSIPCVIGKFSELRRFPLDSGWVPRFCEVIIWVCNTTIRGLPCWYSPIGWTGGHKYMHRHTCFQCLIFTLVHPPLLVHGYINVTPGNFRIALGCTIRCTLCWICPIVLSFNHVFLSLTWSEPYFNLTGPWHWHNINAIIIELPTTTDTTTFPTVYDIGLSPSPTMYPSAGTLLLSSIINIIIIFALLLSMAVFFHHSPSFFWYCNFVTNCVLLEFFYQNSSCWRSLDFFKSK